MLNGWYLLARNGQQPAGGWAFYLVSGSKTIPGPFPAVHQEHVQGPMEQAGGNVPGGEPTQPPQGYDVPEEPDNEEQDLDTLD